MAMLGFFAVFSNILKDTQIHILADSDELEVVQQVQVTQVHEFVVSTCEFL